MCLVLSSLILITFLWPNPLYFSPDVSSRVSFASKGIQETTETERIMPDNQLISRANRVLWCDTYKGLVDH